MSFLQKISILLIPGLSACTLTSPPKTYVASSDVTVNAALISVASGLCSFKTTLAAQNAYLGLYLDSVELVLDLAAHNVQKDTLSVDFSKGFQLGPNVGTDHTIEGNRGSKLTLNLKSIATLDKASAKDPKGGDGKAKPKNGIPDNIVTFDKKLVLDSPVAVAPDCVLTPTPAR